MILDVARVDVLQLLVVEVFKVVELIEELGSILLIEGESSQKLELVSEDSVQVSRSISGMSGWEHDELGVQDSSVIKSDLNTGWDSLWVLFVVLLSSVGEGAFFHQISGLLVEEGRVSVIVGGEHEVFPDIIETLGGLDDLGKLWVLEGLSEHGGDDIDHGVVSALSGGGVFLGWVSDDSESWLVGDDIDILDDVDVVLLDEVMFQKEFLDTLEGTGRLVLIESQFEVHSHNSEIISVHRNNDVKRRVSLSWLVQSEDSLRVSEDILGSNKSVHGSLDAKEGSLSGDGGGSSLGVRKLLTGSDGSEWDIVSAEHTDGVLNLLWSGLHEGSVGADGGDGSVDDVVDLVGFEGENLTESSSDFVLEDHGLEGDVTVDVLVLVGGGDHDGVEVVVSEFSGDVSLDGGVVSENGTVGVPLSDGGGVGENGLLEGDLFIRSEASRVAFLGFVVGLSSGGAKGFILQDGWGIGLHGEGRDSADDGVGVEKLASLKNLWAWLSLLKEINSVLT